jgi:ribosomal protein S18 acetylase RimI-like enzyme
MTKFGDSVRISDVTGNTYRVTTNTDPDEYRMVGGVRRASAGIRRMVHDLACIRQAVEGDANAVADMARAFHAEDGHPLSDAGVAALLAMLEPGFAEGLVLLLVVNNEISGYGALSFGYGIEHGGREAFLEDLYIAPGLRNRGYGRLMCTALEEAARGAGCYAMHLEVMSGNPAERLYRRVGFGDRGSRLLTKPLQ